MPWCRKRVGGVVLGSGRHPTVTAHALRLAEMPLVWATAALSAAALAAETGDAPDCEDVASRAAALAPARDGVVALCERVLNASLEPDNVAAKRWALVGMVAAFGALCDVAQVCSIAELAPVCNSCVS